MVAVVEERHAVVQQHFVDGALVLRDGAVEQPLPLLIGVTHPHRDAISEPRSHGLLDQRHHRDRRSRVPRAIAGHRPPQHTGIDLAADQVLHHVGGGGRDAGIDHQWIWFGLCHQAMGDQMVGWRRPGDDADAPLLEPRIAQRVGAVEATALLEEQRVDRAVIWVGDLHQIVALGRAHDQVATMRAECIAHKARRLRVPRE